MTIKMTDKPQYKDVKMPTVLPYTEGFAPDTEYFYYGHLWCGGVNPEAAVWWKDAAGKCHFKCILTGNSFEPLPRVEVANRQIACALFKEIVDRLVRIGILDLPNQREMIANGNSDVIVSIRLANGDRHTYAVPGAWPSDERHREITHLVMETAPEFFPQSKRQPGASRSMSADQVRAEPPTKGKPH